MIANKSVQDRARCWAEIHLGTLQENSKTLHGLLPGNCRLMNILKADAYGHGAIPCAKALAEIYPDDWIGVACLSEAVELRRAGIEQEILILGWTSEQDAETLADLRITQTVFSQAYAEKLAAAAAAIDRKVPCHIKLDTGMSRIGFPCGDASIEDTLNTVAALYQSPVLDITGIFTHFSSAYWHGQADDAYTEMQFRRFMRVCDGLHSRGISPGLRHCCSSPAIVNTPEYALDMCRAGTALYGHLAEEEKLHPVRLDTVLTWKARVAMINSLPRGASVSYGRLATLSRDSRLAAITAGDADGYYRQLTNQGKVLIRGHCCSVVGRVCMDMFMVDVTDYPDVQADDDVLLLGTDETGTVPCEWIFEPLGIGTSAVTCNIRPRVTRIYMP